MKILFLTIGPEIVASSRTRVHQFLPYLHKENIKTRVIYFTSQTQAYKIINNLRRNWLDTVFSKLFSCFSILKFLFLCKGFDIVFIQKILLPQNLISIINTLNGNIIFDFDDAIFLTDRYQHTSNDKFLRRFNYILKKGKCVIVGNNFLKEKVSDLNKNVFILITPIDTNKSSRKDHKQLKNNNIVVGWIGSPESSQYLRDLRDVFKILTEKYDNIRFEFIGADDFYKGKDSFNIKKWNFDNEVEDLQNFDIGIMPLRNDEWCQGKGGYKLLQYMAAGIPCVASPVGINNQLIKEGINGFLVNSPEEWIEKLSLLIEDSELRKKMGKNARTIAEEVYSYEVNAPKLISIFEDVLCNVRRKKI